MHIVEWHIFRFEKLANLPKGKLILLFDLKRKIPDPVPELALEPSVNQIRASSGNTGSFFSPIIPVYNDEDFGMIINWNGVV
jgi:hypothetical protein